MPRIHLCIWLFNFIFSHWEQNMCNLVVGAAAVVCRYLYIGIPHFIAFCFVVLLCVCVCVCLCARVRALSHVQLFATSWTVAYQAPLSMEFSSQEYWSRLPFPTPGDLPDPGIKPTSHVSPALAGGFFTTLPPGKSIALPKVLHFLQIKSLWQPCVVRWWLSFVSNKVSFKN